MLISHGYKFIFIRTMKTASTSVESFFMPYCMSPADRKRYTDILNLKHEKISKYGIVSCEGTWEELRKNGCKFGAHIGAEVINKCLGQMGLDQVFNDYKKFSIVRNPWDTIVSRYFFSKVERKSYPLNKIKNDLIDFIKKHESVPTRHGTVEGIIEINKPPNLWVLTIDGELICDYYIRYESLQEDIKNVCKQLNIENINLGSLRKFRSNSRPKLDYRECYTKEAIDLVGEIYKEYIEVFNYKFD